MDLNNAVTRQELAELLGVSVPTVLTIVKNTPSSRRGGTWFYDLTAVKAQVKADNLNVLQFLGYESGEPLIDVEGQEVHELDA